MHKSIAEIGLNRYHLKGFIFWFCLGLIVFIFSVAMFLYGISKSIKPYHIESADRFFALKMLIAFLVGALTVALYFWFFK